jgi:hypothetical protein
MSPIWFLKTTRFSGENSGKRVFYFQTLYPEIGYGVRGIGVLCGETQP